MSKLLMLGTGHGMVKKMYNACFIIQNEEGNFLIDTGGSAEILNRLDYFGVQASEINNIFISHSHIDHIMGLIWLFKSLSSSLSLIKDKIHVYANDDVIDTIEKLMSLLLPVKLIDLLLIKIELIKLKNNEKVKINGCEYLFFDLNASSCKQFGFEVVIDKKKMFFLGDVTLNKNLYSRIINSDIVLHEAFCLDEEEKKFGAYSKQHSTVKSVCEVMEKLSVKKLILFHTEETHGAERQKLYLNEGKKYFHKMLFVPNDLETIDLDVIDKVGAIILKDKKILVQRKKNNRKECIIPGGKREQLENDFQTLQRELFEEITVEVKKATYFGDYDDLAVFSNKPLHVCVYLVDISGKIKCNNEIKEAIFIDRNYKEKEIEVGSILGDYVIPELVKRGLM